MRFQWRADFFLIAYNLTGRRGGRTLVGSSNGSVNCDSPKRKDQRLDFSTKLSNGFISSNGLIKNPTITDYFPVNLGLIF